jgi:hypothetical protein
MTFTIRQNSELPTLKLRLYRDGRNDYNNFDDLIENAVITFAMRDSKTGIYKVANKTANVVLKSSVDENSKKEYYISYNFTSEDTNKPGVYIGQFKIIFLDVNLQPSGSLIVPINEELYIHVLDSFIKSDVIYVN